MDLTVQVNSISNIEFILLERMIISDHITDLDRTSTFHHIHISRSALPLSRFPDFTPLALDVPTICCPRGFRDFQPKGTRPYLFSIPASTIITHTPIHIGRSIKHTIESPSGVPIDSQDYGSIIR